MPRLQDIFVDGPEYVRRSVRRASLRRRLRSEQRSLNRLLTRLGEKAWSRREDGATLSRAAEEIEKFEKSRDRKAVETERRIAKVEKELVKLGAQAEAKEQELRAVNNELLAVERQLSSRKAVTDDLEKKTAKAKITRAALKDDLAFCRRQISELDTSGIEDSEARRSGLEATRESLESRISEVSRDMKKLQRRMRINREVLPGLRESFGGIRNRRDALASSAAASRKKHRQLKRRLLQDKASLKQILAPFDKKLGRLYRRFGKELLTARPDDAELKLMLTAIDLSKSVVDNLENDIQSETVLLGLLDKDAVDVFFGVLVGAGMLGLVLIALLIALLVVLL